MIPELTGLSVGVTVVGIAALGRAGVDLPPSAAGLAGLATAGRSQAEAGAFLTGGSVSIPEGCGVITRVVLQRLGGVLEDD